MIAPDSASVSVAVGDHRRLAQRMHGAQLRRRQHGLRVALVALDLVGQAQLFQQPEDALRARVVEVMESDHSPSSAEARASPGKRYGFSVSVRDSVDTPCSSNASTATT